AEGVAVQGVGPPVETGLGPVNLVRTVGERSAILGHFTQTWISRAPIRITGHGRSRAPLGATRRRCRSAPPGAAPPAPVRPPAGRPRTPPGRPVRPPRGRGGRARRGRPSWSRRRR